MNYGILTGGEVSNLVAVHVPSLTPSYSFSVSDHGVTASAEAGMFERLTVPALEIIVTVNLAFRSGSSQHGSARRASVA